MSTFTGGDSIADMVVEQEPDQLESPHSFGAGLYLRHDQKLSGLRNALSKGKHQFRTINDAIQPASRVKEGLVVTVTKGPRKIEHSIR